MLLITKETALQEIRQFSIANRNRVEQVVLKIQAAAAKMADTKTKYLAAQITFDELSATVAEVYREMVDGFATVEQMRSDSANMATKYAEHLAAIDADAGLGSTDQQLKDLKDRLVADAFVVRDYAAAIKAAYLAQGQVNKVPMETHANNVANVSAAIAAAVAAIEKV